jgi:outer membrane protein assembly factor BamB
LVLPSAVARAADDAPVWPQFGQGGAHLGVSPFETPQPPYRQRWKFETPGDDRSLSSPVVVGDTVIALSKRAVYGIDLATGRQRWRIPRNDGSVLAGPAVAEVGGTPILLFTQGGQVDVSGLVAFSLADPDAPSLLWQVPLRDRIAAGVSVSGDTAFVADVSGNVMAVQLVDEVRGVDTDRNLVRWEHTSPGVIPNPPAVANGKVVVVARSKTTGAIEIDALSESTGQEAWSIKGGQSSAASAVTIDGNRAIVGYGEGTGTGLLVAYALSDGLVEWSTRVASPFLPFTDIPVAGGHALALANRLGVESGLYRVDLADGRRATPWNFGTDGLWSFEFDTSGVFSSPIVVGGSVVLGFDDGRMAAVDVTSGEVTWRTELIEDKPVRGLAAADGVVLVSIGSRDGGIVALENDPGGDRLAEVSSSKPDWGVMLAHYAAAFGGVGVAAGLIGLLLRSRRQAAAGPPDDDDAPEEEPA